MPQTEEDVQAAPVELREGEDVVQLYLEYDSLQLGELNAILAHLSSAYDMIRRSLRVRKRAIKVRTALGPRVKRISARQRVAPLRIATIDSRHSIILICIGAAVVIERLANTAIKVFKARKEGWESSEAKWKAKTAKIDYETALNKPLPVLIDPKAMSSVTQDLTELAEDIEYSNTIKAVRLTLDGFSWTHVKSDTTRTLKP